MPVEKGITEGLLESLDQQRDNWNAKQKEIAEAENFNSAFAELASTLHANCGRILFEELQRAKVATEIRTGSRTDYYRARHYDKMSLLEKAEYHYGDYRDYQHDKTDILPVDYSANVPLGLIIHAYRPRKYWLYDGIKFPLTDHKRTMFAMEFMVEDRELIASKSVIIGYEPGFNGTLSYFFDDSRPSLAHNSSERTTLLARMAEVNQLLEPIAQRYSETPLA